MTTFAPVREARRLWERTAPQLTMDFDALDEGASQDRRVLPSAPPSPAPVLQAGNQPKPCSTVGGEHPTTNHTNEAVSQSSWWARETASRGV